MDNADIFVMVIGGRYGSERSATRTDAVKAFYEQYDSITKEEYRAAPQKDIPIYILVERPVYADYETYLRNRTNETINYAHVDSANVFGLIEEIISQHRNNPVYQFDKASEIEAWLREQWAGYFRELLSRTASQKQISSLVSQVDELKEINRTLRTYLEEIVTTVVPEKSKQLIEGESQRLLGFEHLRQIADNPMVNFLAEDHRDLKMISSIRDAGVHSKSFHEFIRALYDLPGLSTGRIKQLEKYLELHDYARKDFAKFRSLVGNPKLRLPRRQSSIAHQLEFEQIGDLEDFETEDMDVDVDMDEKDSAKPAEPAPKRSKLKKTE